MAFVKVTKKNSYFKRYQVKFRRRREFKTDYAARRTMVKQDLNKYDSKRYRLVVRSTNKKIITQIIYSSVTGDHCMAQATSQELRKWGLTTGFTSYAAAYATGLLVARRLLQKLKMDTVFKGAEELGGGLYDVSVDPKALENDKRPFKCVLDIGLVSTSTGNRVFGALKGACDGGLHVPHSSKRFPGYRVDKDAAPVAKKGQVAAPSKKGVGSYDAEEHESRIYGSHIQEYYEKLQGEDKEAFTRQFSQWEKCLAANANTTIPDLFEKIQEAILLDPSFTKKPTGAKQNTEYTDARKTLIKCGKGKVYLRNRKLTIAERKEKIARKLQVIAEN